MIKTKANYDLSACNTFRMKAKCAYYIEYDKAADLESIDMDSLPQPIICIGEGSNLLLTGDFPGTVLHSSIKFTKYVDLGMDEVPIAVGAGVKFDDFVAETCAHGLWGAENLSLIPGQVGAAAVQNIGAYGVEIKDIVSGVVCFDMQERRKVTFQAGECNYSYRSSRFKEAPDKGRYIVTSVLFRLHRSYNPSLGYKGVKEALGGRNPETPGQVRDAIIRVRREKLPDPSEMGSAGSYFKNPVVPAYCVDTISKAVGGAEVPFYTLPHGMVKIPAAWLIDKCGLKGFRIGGAGVHEMQPLVLVNYSGQATAAEVLALENEVVSRVNEKFRILLQREVEHI